MKGTSVAANSRFRPRNRYRANTHAVGRPTARVRIVDRIACHSVNSATPWSVGSLITSPNTERSRDPSIESPRTVIDTSGYAKK